MDLATRLAALVKKHDTSIHSELKSISTPLATYLSLFYKAGKYHSLGYMGTATVLYKYLAPIEIPEIADSLLPDSTPVIFNAPMLNDITKLIRPSLLGDTGANILARHERVYKTIVYLTLKDIMK